MVVRYLPLGSMQGRWTYHLTLLTELYAGVDKQPTGLWTLPFLSETMSHCAWIQGFSSLTGRSLQRKTQAETAEVHFVPGMEAVQENLCWLQTVTYAGSKRPTSPWEWSAFSPFPPLWAIAFPGRLPFQSGRPGSNGPQGVCEALHSKVFLLKGKSIDC